jgi:nitrogen fixation NifU-like protein
MDPEQIYREKLLEHYHHPHNVGTLERPDFSSTEYNHSCGDQIQMEGHIRDGVLVRLKFVGVGCILSQAVASMLTELCKGKSLQEVLALDKDYIMSLIGMSLGPTRLRCALLPLYAIQHGIQAYLQEQEADELL